MMGLIFTKINTNRPTQYSLTIGICYCCTLRKQEILSLATVPSECGAVLGVNRLAPVMVPNVLALCCAGTVYCNSIEEPGEKENSL